MMLVPWFGCTQPSSPDPTEEADADVDADADADSDADTDPETDPAPVALELACAPTDNPLRFTCAVGATPAAAVDLSWVRVDGLGPVRTRSSATPSDEHTFDVTWLAGEQPYEVAAASGATRVTTTLTPGVPPAAVASRLTFTGASSFGLVGGESPCDQGAWAVVYDTTTGDLVWFQNLDPAGTLGMLDMVRFTDAGTIVGETDGNVVEVDPMGRDLTRFPVDYPGCCSLNHEIFVDGGVYLSQFQNTFGGLTLDNVVALDASGAELYQWDPAAFLPIPGYAFGDWLHTNAESFDAGGDLLLSWLNRDAIGKFVGDRSDPAWGERVWVMTGDGEDGPLGNDVVVDWSNVDGPDGFGGQHNLHPRHDGRLMMLDNDNGRALVFTVDDATGTATIDAAYPTHEAACSFQGTAMDGANGNALVGCVTPWVREYDGVTGALTWEAEVGCRDGTGGGFSAGASVRWYPLDTWQ